MQVGGAEDHGFLVAERVQFLHQLFADDTVEVLIDYAAVEGIHFEAEFVLQLGGVHFSGLGVDDVDRFSLLKGNAVLGKEGFVADGWFMIDQPVIRHRFPVGVGVHGLAEDFAGVLGRGGGQTDFHRIEIVQHAAVAGQVLAGVPQGQFAFGHFLVQGVAAVGLVDDDAVELVDGRRVVAHKDTFHHGLHGGHLNACFRFSGHVAQLGNVVDLAEGVVLFQRCFVEGVDGLLAQCGAVYQKQDAVEAFGFQETVHQPDDGAGFTGAGGHGQQRGANATGQGVFGGDNGVLLVIPQFQVAEGFVF